MHTPMGEVGGPKGIHEQVLDTLHTACTVKKEREGSAKVFVRFLRILSYS